jgi:transcriptional regulator with AAA-type ATPase domain/predicted ATPase
MYERLHLTPLIAESPSLLRILELASKAARTNAAILITGETGTGKSLLARWIHENSSRTGEFVSLNSASFQPNLFEAHLFGYARGAFTGAERDTQGLIEQAHEGTLFLDEVGDMPREAQPRMLRVLEDGVVRRVGGANERKVNVRLVCATNHDLGELARRGEFRPDLFYRISAFAIEMPPLRDRTEDIPALARHLLTELCHEFGLPPHILRDDALAALLAYHWPGNIRELRSALTFALTQADDQHSIGREHLPTYVFKLVPRLQVSYGEAAENPELHELLGVAILSSGRNRGDIARFLHALVQRERNVYFNRHSIVALLASLRQASHSALINEWNRHLRPMLIESGLVRAAGGRLRVDTEAVARALRHPTDAPERGHVSGNMPTPPSSFVGRRNELERLSNLLRGDAELITLLGPGGVGKTRLAQEVALRSGDSFPGGCWFVALENARDEGGFYHACSKALGIPFVGATSERDSVLRAISQRAPFLLILDNLEQLFATAPTCVSDLLAASSQGRIMATSRAVLGVEGEALFELEPLGVPSAGSTELADILSLPAVQLFEDRARFASTAFEVTERNAQAVAALCLELEGLPLAIELAAARVSILQVGQILERMRNRFALLRSPRKDVSTRQRSLEGAIEWSYDLLDDAEKSVFEELALFAGGFSLETAERVVEPSDGRQVIDVVQSLRDKSLLRTVEECGVTRYLMFAAIRQFALRRLSETHAKEVLEQLHYRIANALADLTEEWSALVFTDRCAEAFGRLSAEQANAEEVLAWLGTDSPGINRAEADHLYIRIALATAYASRSRGPHSTRYSRLNGALKCAHRSRPDLLSRVHVSLAHWYADQSDMPLAMRSAELGAETATNELQRARAISFDAWLRRISGDVPGAVELLELAFPVLEVSEDKSEFGRVLLRMAFCKSALGKSSECLSLLERAEEVLQPIGDTPGLALLFSTWSNFHYASGEAHDADVRAELERPHLVEIADQRSLGIHYSNRVLILEQLRKYDDALAESSQAEHFAREIGDRALLGTILTNRGNLLLDLDKQDDAMNCFRQGAVHYRAIGNTGGLRACLVGEAWVLWQRGERAAARRVLDRCGVEDGPALMSTLNWSEVVPSLADILIDDNRLEEAERLMTGRQGEPARVNPVNTRDIHTAAVFVRLYTRLGRGDEARRMAVRALEFADSRGMARGAAPRLARALRDLRSVSPG